MKPIRSLFAITILLLAGCRTIAPSGATGLGDDPYAAYVWPPPPDEARIRLVDIIDERSDVEAGSRLAKALMGATRNAAFDRLKRPIAVAMDGKSRIYVTDIELSALVRFDRGNRRMDVFGKTGSVRLRTPVGVSVGGDGRIYVADGALRKVVVFDDDGGVVQAYGREGELANPTDAELSPDGKTVWVADSKAHCIVVFDAASGTLRDRIGKRGNGDGEFNYPSALAFDADGALFVLDQMNSRVQILSPEGEFLESLGSLGTGFGQFVRPKGLAIDAKRFVYVTDAAFNNVQIFDSDLRLLTFVGTGGSGPGQFRIAGGVAANGDEFAVIDQLNRRVQVFRYLERKNRP